MHEANGSDLIEQLPNHPELTERVELRATPEDVQRWREAGRIRGLTLSAYVRQAARELSLHPSIAAGVVQGAWLDFAKRAVDAVIEQLVRARLEPRPPVDMIVRLTQPVEIGGSEPPRRKPAKKKAKR